MSAAAKRIALLHYSFPPVVGGVESVLGRHALLLEAHGHAVRVLAGRGEPWRDGADFRRIPLADSRHEEIGAAKRGLDGGRIPAGFDLLVDRIVADLGQALAETDLVFAHNVGSLHKNLALTAALRRWHDSSRPQRLVLWHHDSAWNMPPYRGELHAGYPWDLLRTPWPGARMVTISSARRDELSPLFGVTPGEIRVVPNGIDLAAFLRRGDECRAWAERLNLREAEPLLLLPARVTRRKNIELALRTLASLRREFPQAGLLVTGPLGPHNPANREYFEELLTLRDRLGLSQCAWFLAEAGGEGVSDAAITDFYLMSDALLLPSREEGFGLPLLEAAAARRPVFCADLPPLRELAGVEARMFSPDADPQMVADLIARTLRADLAFLFAARVRREYSWEGIYRRHLEPLLAGECADSDSQGGSR